jgi:hypothetical protein
MWFENYVHFYAKEDGCTYLYSTKTRKWKKLCDVERDDIPQSANEQIAELSRITMEED